MSEECRRLPPSPLLSLDVAELLVDAEVEDEDSDLDEDEVDDEDDDE